MKTVSRRLRIKDGESEAQNRKFGISQVIWAKPYGRCIWASSGHVLPGSLAEGGDSESIHGHFL